MGFAEALSDDGSLTGRGETSVVRHGVRLHDNPGGIGHSVPFLIPNFRTATVLALLVVAIDSWSLVGFESATWIRHFFAQCFTSLLVEFA
jgi:erythrin-vacuolar iron transport family protein